MNTLAYINGDITTEQYQGLLKQNVTSILIDVPQVESNKEQKTNSLELVIDSLSAGDQVIIYNLTNLCCTLSELASIFERAKQKKINLVILNKDEIFNNMTSNEFMDFIFDLNEENRRVIKEKKQRMARNGKNIGRPKLSQENIEKIRYLRLEKKYSLRDTAELCGVSVGTVHKYADRASE